MAYIDREELCRRINECWETNDIDKGRVIQQVIDRVITPIVVGTPTADVVEVKHGKWKNSGDCDWRCTNCNEYFTLDIDMHPIDDCGMNYCPNCGAKMDLVGD